MKKKDILDEYISRMPQAGLSASFREQMMTRIFEEKIRMERRQVRITWISVAAGVVSLLGLAVWAFLNMDIKILTFSIPLSALNAIPFYGYIGFLALLLLGADHLLRKKIRRKWNVKKQSV